MKSTGARTIGAGPTGTSPKVRGQPLLSSSPSMKGTLEQILSIPEVALERRLTISLRVDEFGDAVRLAARVSLSRISAHQRAIHCAASWMSEKMYPLLVVGRGAPCSGAGCATVVYRVAAGGASAGLPLGKKIGGKRERGSGSSDGHQVSPSTASAAGRNRHLDCVPQGTLVDGGIPKAGSRIKNAVLAAGCCRRRRQE